MSYGLFEPIGSVLSSTDTQKLYKVKRVIDGDTFILQNGQKVRLIGVDSPETVSPKKSIECFGKQSSTQLKLLIEGQEVYLERDISDKDKYGRLLRYVWIDDRFVNNILVQGGFARSYAYKPDTRYQSLFNASQLLAKASGRGIWSPECKKQ